MQSIDIWNKYNIYRAKIVLLVLAFFLITSVQAQQQEVRWIKKNNPNYDNKKLTYGFLIGIHSTAYQIKYSDKFITPEFDTVYAVQPQWSPGFSLGFIMNYKLADLLDFRVTPKVAFYEHKLRYLFTNDTPTEEQLVETTMVELPILLKFKSERRGNARVYMVGGIKPGFEASGKRKEDNVSSALEVKSFNMNLDVGFGFDLYYPLFKFSPEIRFSHGLLDMLDNRTNRYGQPLDRINTNTVTIYLLFQ